MTPRPTPSNFLSMAIKPHNRPDYDYSRYVLEHGTTAEVEKLRAEVLFMRDLTKAFPGSSWEPMSQVVLIEHLRDRADRIAARRLDAAKKLRYRDHQGKVGRSIAEERQTVRAQLAVQVMLGLPLGKPNTYQEARKVGNCGGGHEAFLPLYNPLSHHLIVDPRTKDEIICWLVLDEGGYAYRLAGWIPAIEAKQAMFERRRQREGGMSVAFWVSTGALYSVEEWWQSNP